MSEWKEYRLSDVCNKIGSGATPRGGAESYQSTGEYSLIRSQNVLDYNFTMKGLAYINEAQASKLNNVEVKERDILLNITGDSVARVCLVPQSVLPARVNQHVAIIRPNSDYLTNEYLKYYLLEPSIKDYLLMLSSSGGTRNAITKSMIEELVIQAPDLPTQTAIAEILSSLDDKIELNNKINQELETLAQTLFKQWFIDFEFPNENGEPYKSSGGEMVDSELGEIPKGWKVKRLDEISNELTRGFTTKYVEKSSLINLNQKVNRGKFLDKSNFKYYPNDTNVPINKFAKQKDILINSLGQGTLGRMHFYKENTSNVVVDQHITILRSNSDNYLPEILYLMLTFPCNQSRLEEMVTGSTGMLMLNINKIREFKVVVPPTNYQELLNSSISKFFDKISCSFLENEKLSALRNTLLPKLISGELEINEISN